MRDPSEYYCPRCKSYHVEVFEDKTRFKECGLTFPIDVLNGDFEDENILAEEESYSILSAFEEFKDENIRNAFKKSLDEDFPLE